MTQARKRTRKEEHPAVVAARRNRKLMASVRESIRGIVAGEKAIPGRQVIEEARRRHEQL